MAPSARALPREMRKCAGTIADHAGLDSCWECGEAHRVRQRHNSSPRWPVVRGRGNVPAQPSQPGGGMSWSRVPDRQRRGRRQGRAPSSMRVGLQPMPSSSGRIAAARGRGACVRAWSTAAMHSDHLARGQSGCGSRLGQLLGVRRSTPCATAPERQPPLAAPSHNLYKWTEQSSHGGPSRRANSSRAEKQNRGEYKNSKHENNKKSGVLPTSRPRMTTASCRLQRPSGSARPWSPPSARPELHLQLSNCTFSGGLLPAEFLAVTPHV